MLLVILAIGFLLLGIACFIYFKYGKSLYAYDNEWVYIAGFIISACIIVISLLAFIITGAEYLHHTVVDEKIMLYEEENTKIEKEIAILVSTYQEFEKETYRDFKNESPTVLVNMYPELKSNELVKEQITLYTENNKKIKQLKEEKINYKLKAWWLFLK